jgi:glycine dehydrogenase subunit 2
MKLIFEKSVHGRTGVLPGPSDVPTGIHIREDRLRRHSAELPELSELDVVRHFTELSRRNFGVDTNFYPLGSCTMKYNPKVNERIAGYPGLAHLHPLLPQLRRGGMLTQGALAILYDMDLLLREITAMAGFTMQPLAGAHGELTGMMIMAAYHRDKGNKKSIVLAPDSAHGTNPASAAIAGYRVVSIPSTESGDMDLDALKRALNDQVAGIMLTCPSTLGLFDPNIKEICDLIHSVDGLAYYDGANLNAIVGKARPGDFGFDIVHLNLHKTFATPHGGGGPGSGPVAVDAELVEYLPGPLPQRSDDGTVVWEMPASSIGRVHGHHGNFLVVLRALTYMRALGGTGLRRVSERAVLNARYLERQVEQWYEIPYTLPCMHEFVASAARLKKETGVRAMDVAKGLIDRGFHAPTVYFPLVVDEALMVEPTETESVETIDALAAAFGAVAAQAHDDAAAAQAAPVTTPVSHPDDARAARHLVITWDMEGGDG